MKPGQFLTILVNNDESRVMAFILVEVQLKVNFIQLNKFSLFEVR